MFHITTYSKAGIPTKIENEFSSVEEAQKWVMENCFKHPESDTYIQSVRWLADLNDGQIARLQWERKLAMANEDLLYANDDLSAIFIDRSDITREHQIDRFHETLSENAHAILGMKRFSV